VTERSANDMKNLSLASRTYVAFGAAVVLLAVSGWISYRTTRSSMASAAWVDHTYEVLAELGSLRATVTDAQSARRGFVLTGDAASFRQFEDAAAAAAAKLDRLRYLTLDNPVQVRQIADLRPVITMRLAQMRQTMVERRANGFDATRQAELTEQGRPVQRRVNDGISHMEQEEKDLLRGRQGTAGRSQTMTLAAISGSSILAVLIVILAMQRIRADLQRRLDAERQVLEANGLMRAVFDASTETSIIATDSQGLITVFNSGAEKMLGYSAEEMIGRQTPAVLSAPPEAAETSAGHIAELNGFESVIEKVRQQGRQVGERIYVRKDGSRVPVRLAVTATHGENQEVSGFLGVGVDMTEARRAERAIREGEARFRLLLDSAAEAIYGIDQQGLCTFCNKACVRMLGYQNAADLLRHNMHNLIHTWHADGSPYLEKDCPIRATLQAGESVHRDSEVLWRANGSSFPVEYWAYPMMRDGKMLGAVVTFLDITERRENERMKNEFVSIVSHELRTPLTSIRGALGLLAGGLLRTQPEKQQRMLDIAITNTDRLVRLINDILDIERMESGKTVLRSEVCDAGQLMSLAAETMQAMAGKAQVRIEATPQAISFRADPDRILQVLSNLLSNAIKFSPPDGLVSLSASPSEGQVVFEVRDQGRGIPADKLETIFERFQQVDASDAREKGGTGLGLPICRAIAQQHGGRIWAMSVVGAGSCFFLSLPMETRITEAVAPVKAPVRTVLVCDDEEANRSAIAALLEQRGYRTILAASGSDAVALALANRPDAVLLDLVMPGMDGWQTLQRLKEHSETRDIPILILEVAPGPDPAVATSVERIPKPLDEEKLLEWLGRAARSHQATRVLIVEDDADLARVLVGLFERRGIQVFHAGSGKEAIELSDRVEPDLLVLDLGLPEGDGFSVVEGLRRNHKLRSVPLVIYTAREDLSTEEREKLRLGNTQFITKSRLSLPEFEQGICRLLDALCKERKGGNGSDATIHGS
jgi:PAS domain S-box-containing protein